MREVSARTAQAWMQSGEAEFIDVREPFEFSAAHIQGSRPIPLRQFNQNALPVDKTLKVVLVCASGARSRSACAAVGQENPHVYSLAGGMGGWRAAGGAVEGNDGGAIMAILRKLAAVALMIGAAYLISRAFRG